MCAPQALVLATLLTTLLAVGCERNAPAPSAAPSSAPAAPTAEQAERESARLNEWLDARFEEQLDFSPLMKTRLGRKDETPAPVRGEVVLRDSTPGTAGRAPARSPPR